MIKVNATNLRNSLFDYLDMASKGETIIIERNNEEVARLVPVHQTDWRDRMTMKPEIRVTPEVLIQPLEDIWEEYL